MQGSKSRYSTIFLELILLMAFIFSNFANAAAPSILLLNSKAAKCPFKVNGEHLQVNLTRGVRVYQDASVNNLETAGCITNLTAVTEVSGEGLKNIVSSKEVVDPFLSLPAPKPGPAIKVPGCTNKQNAYVVDASNAASCQKIQAGYYPGGIVVDNVNANLTMAPGIYILGANGFVVRDGTVDGSGGIMIYIMPKSSGSPKIELSTSKLINLKGIRPETFGLMPKNYEGILFFQDRSNQNDIKINDVGSGIIILEGSIYAPSAKISVKVENSLAYSGSNVFFPGIIADTIAFAGVGAVNPASLTDLVVINNFLHNQYVFFPAALHKHTLQNCQFTADFRTDHCVCSISFVSPKTGNLTLYTIKLGQFNQATLEMTASVNLTVTEADAMSEVDNSLSGTDPIKNGSLKSWCTKDRVVSVP